MEAKFRVEVVTANLAPAETYAQILHSLKSLEAASAGVFDGRGSRSTLYTCGVSTRAQSFLPTETLHLEAAAVYKL